MGITKGRLQIDSRGWIHHVHAPTDKGSFTYSVSTDGAKTWKRREVRLPEGHVVEDFDFRSNGKLGLSAVAIHARNKPEKVDQDLALPILGGDPNAALRPAVSRGGW